MYSVCLIELPHMYVTCLFKFITLVLLLHLLQFHFITLLLSCDRDIHNSNRIHPRVVIAATLKPNNQKVMQTNTQLEKDIPGKFVTLDEYMYM